MIIGLRLASAALLASTFGVQCVKKPPARGPESPRSARTLARDGVPIAYTVQGGGATSIVFVHGWSCDRTYWSEQLRPFARSRRVVAVDLAGHGESGAGRTEWTLESLAGDVVAVLEAENLREVILIGHSMGAPVSLLVAQAVPARVRAVIAIDALHDVERSGEEEYRDIIASLEADFEGTLRSDVPRYLFPPDADPDLVTRVAADMSKAPPQIAIALIRSLAALDLKRALAEVHVPVRCINAMPTNLVSNRKYARDFDAVQMPGVGHFPMLERPRTFNALLERVVSEIEAGDRRRENPPAD